MKGIFKAALCAALLFASAAVTRADSYSLANNNGGDGYIVGSLPSFQLFGADNGPGAGNYTTYTTTVSAPETISFHWSYITHDVDGSYWDPAGYVLNGVFTQVSTSADPFSSPGTIDSSGFTSLTLAAGNTFGWYVYTVDNQLGRGELDVTATPEPGSLLLLGTGLLGLAAVSLKKLAF